MVRKFFTSLTLRLLVIFFLSFSVAGIVMYYSFQESMFITLQKFDWRLLMIGLLMIIVSWILDGMRLQNLVRATASEINLVDSVRIQLITEFTTALTPSGMGGGPIKIWLIQRQGLSIGNATTVFTVDKVVDIVFLAIVLPLYFYIMSLSHVSLPLNLNPETGIIFSIVLLVSLAITVIYSYKYMKRRYSGQDLMNVIFQSKLTSWWLPFKFRSFLMDQSLTILHQLKIDIGIIVRTKKSVFLYNLFLSAIKWNLRYGVLPFVLYFGFDLQVNYYLIFLLQGLIFFGSFFIMTPGGTGGAEIAYSVVFKPFIPIHIMGISLLIWRFYTYYIQIIMGGIIVFVSMGKEGIRTLLEMQLKNSKNRD